MHHKRLTTISTTLKVLGWIVIAVGVVATGMVASAIQGGMATVFIILAGLLAVASAAAVLFSFAYFIPLLINIEGNTTQAREHLKADR
jgi:hypothetical protein